VVDRNGNTIINAPINASLNQTSWPIGTDWINTIYGIKSAPAQEMLNKTLAMQSSTDSNGGVSFTMIASLGYDLEIIDPSTGIAYLRKLFPLNREYTIWLQTGEDIFTTNNTYSQLQETKLTYLQPDINSHTLGVYYHDPTCGTDYLMFWVETPINGTHVFTSNITGPGCGPVLLNTTLPNVRGEELRWNYDAYRTV
jgi:hypothetical protein